jgi:hypothetical protein
MSSYKYKRHRQFNEIEEGIKAAHVGWENLNTGKHSLSDGQLKLVGQALIELDAKSPEDAWSALQGSYKAIYIAQEINRRLIQNGIFAPGNGQMNGVEKACNTIFEYLRAMNVCCGEEKLFGRI